MPVLLRRSTGTWLSNTDTRRTPLSLYATLKSSKKVMIGGIMRCQRDSNDADCHEYDKLERTST